ncbi:hypothetical protein BDV30DRAFT_221984 [Aspergillus minisclerotigenes]|uniref:NACHT domain-containing protein n=1 Tax=Aspergillus minisclerotigenes TaxID=656917 RepID=A0A5N6IJ28_9EURO|nr:hypothetical protein BDV30DRAFT_221984 [Aspergillus minisclerotigenes]
MKLFTKKMDAHGGSTNEALLANDLRGERQASGPRDLWGEALTKIKKSDREYLNLHYLANGSNVGLIIDRIKQIGVLCEQYRSSREENTLANEIKEAAEKTVKYALKIKTLGDAAVKFDKSGYAALAWSLVSFGLELGVNDQTRRGEFLSASKYLADLLARYSIIEAHYRNPAIPEVSHMEERVTSIYAGILRYCAEVGKALDRNPLGRAKDAFTALIGEPLKELKQKIGEADEAVDKSLRIVEYIDIKKAQQDEERKKLLEKLELMKTSDLHIRYVESRYGETCRWIYEATDYKAWIDQNVPVLWLYGPSGIGKSVLFSTIIHPHLPDTTSASSNFAYWYFDRDNVANNHTHACLRSIAAQLINGREELSEEVQNVLHMVSRPNQSPEKSDLEKAIASIAKEEGTDVVIAIDGLDECPDVKQLVTALTNIENLSEWNTRMLLVSQPGIDISGLQPLELDLGSERGKGAVRLDVGLYVRGAVGDADNLKEFYTKITSSLLGSKKRKKRMVNFRLAALQIDRLKSCRGKHEVMETLKAIPKSMEASYKTALEDLVNVYGLGRARNVHNLVKWILVAKRKLTTRELSDVLELTAKNIIAMCPSSLIITPSERVAICATTACVQTVQFAHPSVRTFFTTSNPLIVEGFNFAVELDAAELEIGKFCMDRLHNLKNMESVKETLEQKPLLAYAAEYWPSHVVVEGDAMQIRNEMFSSVSDFFDSKKHNQFCNWLQIHDPDSGGGTKDAPCQVYYALLLGFPEIVESMVCKGQVDAECDIPYFGSMLQMASFLGQGCIAKTLLGKANPNHRAGVFGSALEAAAARGHENIVDDLLCAGADAEFIGGILGSPRKAAQSGGYGKIVERLFAFHAKSESDVESTWRFAFDEVIKNYPCYSKSRRQLETLLLLVGHFRFAHLLRREQQLLIGFIQSSHPETLLEWVQFLDTVPLEEWCTMERRRAPISLRVPPDILRLWPCLLNLNLRGTVERTIQDLRDIHSTLSVADTGTQSVRLEPAIGNPVAILKILLGLFKSYRGKFMLETLQDLCPFIRALRIWLLLTQSTDKRSLSRQGKRRLSQLILSGFFNIWVQLASFDISRFKYFSHSEMERVPKSTRQLCEDIRHLLTQKGD